MIQRGSETNRRLPELFIDQARLGEAGPQVRAALEAEQRGGANRELDASDLDAADASILAQYPDRWFADRVSERLARGGGDAPRRFSTTLFIGAPALAAAAVAVFVLLISPLASNGGADPSGGGSAVTTREASADDAQATARGERIKGLEPELTIFMQDAAGGASELPDGATVYENASLQVAFRSAGYRHAAIISIDGRGVVTLHTPSSPMSPTAIDDGGEVLLPWAYILDDAPLFEDFYLALSNDPIDVSRLIEIAERAATSGRRDLTQTVRSIVGQDGDVIRRDLAKETPE